MMRRRLTGSLEDLGAPVLLRVLAAASASGTLELDTPEGRVTLEVAQGRIPAQPGPELERLGRLLFAGRGRYAFESGAAEVPAGDSVSLVALVEASDAAHRRRHAGLASDSELSSRLDRAVADFPEASSPSIHVLPSAPPTDPLGDFLSELEATAPEELLLAQVVVVAADPRPWRGRLEAEWRRRGWRLRLEGNPRVAELAGLDALVVHHQLSITRVGQEEDWLDLIRRAAGRSPSLPVVWIGPLGDSTWVHRLISAGVGFLLPAPQGDAGETLARFIDDVTVIVERQLKLRSRPAEDVPAGVGELVEAVLHGVDPDQVAGSLLQMAAGRLHRGAILVVEGTAVRSRAGFGYALDQGSLSLPRGLGVVERVVRSGSTSTLVDAEAAGAQQLARLLGLERLAEPCVVIPLQAGADVVGLLVGDCGGDPLPDLADLELVARRLGGAAVRG